MEADSDDIVDTRQRFVVIVRWLLVSVSHPFVTSHVPHSIIPLPVVSNDYPHVTSLLPRDSTDHPLVTVDFPGQIVRKRGNTPINTSPNSRFPPPLSALPRAR